MKRALCLVALITSCAGPGDDDGSGGVDAPVMPSFEYQPFTARTRSIGSPDAGRQLSITDTVGPIACGVAQDHHSALGTSGHQIIAAVELGADFPCPVGTTTIRSDCTTPLPMFGDSVIDGCAYYRRFSAQGQVLGTIAATAGAIVISGDDLACRVTVNLSFAGEAYTDTFTLANGTGTFPWCTP